MIIVVGGSIAGATVAANLAVQGEEVLILERRTSPYSTLSIATIWPDVLGEFDRFGFGEFLDNCGFPRIANISYEFFPGVRITGPVVESRGRNWGYGIRRETLDHLLLGYVGQFPQITIREEFNVTDVVWTGDRVSGVRGRWRDGSSERLNGDIIIAADGKWSTIARAVKAPEYDVRSPRTCFYYAYFRDVERFGAQDENYYATYQGVAPFRFHAFTQVADQGLTGVGVQASEKEFNRFRSEPEATLRACVDNVPELAGRMSRATRETPIMGLKLPKMLIRKPFGNGWILVGDAGLFIDPVTGQGISIATNSAVLVSEAIKKWRRNVPWNRALGWYQQTRDNRVRGNYDRAGRASDFESQGSEWMSRWYAWMSVDQSRSEDFRAMLSNAVPPERFFTPWKLLYAHVRHGFLQDIAASFRA